MRPGQKELCQLDQRLQAALAQRDSDDEALGWLVVSVIINATISILVVLTVNILMWIGV